MSQDTPPPMPEAPEEESTRFIDAAVPPPFPVGEPVPRSRTNTHFAISAVDDADSGGTAQRRKAEARLRRPAARPPTLLPNAQAQQAIRGPSTVRPGVLNPVKRQPEAASRLSGRGRESSDIIAGLPQPTAAPPKMKRRPERPSPRPARAVAEARKPRPQPRQTYNPPHASAAPGLLPLSYEVLASHATQHRRRLKTLYTAAKALEICAGVVGTLSLALMITSIVRLMTSTPDPVMTVVTAFCMSVMGYGLTSVMVVAAIAVRQLAQLSAQTSALIDGLTQNSPSIQR